MKKISLPNKLLITTLLTFFSMLVLVVRITPWMTNTINNQGILYSLAIYYLKDFSLINLLISFFIFCFYYDVYYDGNKYTKKSFFITILSIIFTIVVFLGEVYKSSETIKAISISPAYVIICIMFCIGMYFIFYAIIKKLVLIKNKYQNQLIKQKKVKKKIKLQNKS